MPETALFVDTSRWSKKINCSVLKDNGVLGILPKATQGTNTVDPLFSSTLAGGKASGLIVGAFHYLDITHDPIKQANHFIAATAQLSLLAVDLEMSWTNWNDPENPALRAKPAQIADCAQAFLQQVERSTGKRPMIYTAAWFTDAYMQGNTAWMQNYKLWLAQWPLKKSPAITCGWQKLRSMYLPTTKGPRLPAGCSDWYIWQFTGDKFTLPGIEGKADVNILSRQAAQDLIPAEKMLTLAEKVEILWAAHEGYAG